jgi:hypothetical protein
MHFAIDHVELELEEPTEQAQVEDLDNLVLNQGKPRCIELHKRKEVYPCFGTIALLAQTWLSQT